MKIINYILALFILLSAHQASSQSADGSRPKEIMGLNSPSRIADEYIIMLDKNTVDQQAQTLLINNNINIKQATEIVVNDICTDLALTAQGSILTTYTAAFYGFALDSNSEQAVIDIVNDSRVNHIEVNQVATANSTQLNPTWGLDRIDQKNRPLDNAYNYDQDGTGVTVYVIDSGVRVADSEFEGRASWGPNFVFDQVGKHDCTGHGTHIAGTIGSTTYGVAKNVNIKAIRILDCNNQADTDSIISGINFVIMFQTGSSVINLSVNQPASIAITGSVNNAVEAGITVVVAAGNGNEDACNVSPANASKAITVGATTITDARWVNGAKASNFGSCVDIFAPGTDITSISISATSTLSGTSFASPHVAGAAALYLQENIDATPAEVKEAILTNASVVTISNAGVDSPNKLLNMSNLVTVLDPPDIYEEDDDIYSAKPLVMNNSFQSHNLNDDSSDWIFLRGVSIIMDGEVCPNYNICTLEFREINNADICFQQQELSVFPRGQVIPIGEKKCDLSNTSHSVRTPALFLTSVGSVPYCEYKFSSGLSLTAELYYKISDESGQVLNNKYKIKLNCISSN